MTPKNKPLRKSSGRSSNKSTKLGRVLVDSARQIARGGAWGCWGRAGTRTWLRLPESDKERITRMLIIRKKMTQSGPCGGGVRLLGVV